MAERAIAVVQNNGAIVTETWSREQLDLLKRTVAVGLTDDEFALFVHVARHRRLDPFAKQIYAVKISNRLTFLTSIDGFRLTAQRSGEYAGQDGPYWCGPDGVWKDVWFEADKPAAAKVGVLRTGFKDYVYSVARWVNYGSVNTKNVWATMPDLMLAKCAEALALRRAFPEELSGLYTSDEMDQADTYDAPESRQSAPVRQTAQSSAARQSAPQRQASAPQRRDYGGMRGKPATDAQHARLHAIAKERGWHDDELHGRAGEINPAARDSLSNLDRAQISELMDAVETEPRWVDPRQSSMDIDAVIDATAREVPSSDIPATDPETGEIIAEPDGCWDLDGTFLPPRVSGDPAIDMALVIDAAATAPSARGLKEAWQFAERIGLASDAEVVGAFTARKLEKGWSRNGDGATGAK